MLAWIGPWTAVIIVGLLFLFFGAKRFGAALRSLRRGGREFKHELTKGDGRRDEPPS